MRVLITGACGYLGSRLAEALPHDLVLGARGFPRWAAARFAGREQRVVDVLSSSDVVRAVEGVDAVVHLASLDEIEAARDPELALRVSGEGTRRLLEACRQAGVRRFVYLSTYHVYGVATEQLVHEELPTKPIHPYSISRVAGEGYCFQHNALQGVVQAVVLRMSNGYGAPVDPSIDRWSLAHNDFCRQAFQSGRIVLKTSGAQHRDLVAIDDVASAIDLTLREPHLSHDIFQVGGGSSVSVYELAQRVREVASRELGRDIVIERPEGPQSAPAVLFSIERMKQLGYAPIDRIDHETKCLLGMLTAQGGRT